MINLYRHSVRPYIDFEGGLNFGFFLFSIANTTLYNLFKRVFGMSASKVIQSERVEKLKRLLKNKKLSIGEVANQVGIDDPNYFSRLFKSVVGITPGAYRKMHKTPTSL